MRRRPRGVPRIIVLISTVCLLSACGLMPQVSGGASGGSNASAAWRDDVRLTVEGVLAEPDPPRDTVPQCPVDSLGDRLISAFIGDVDGIRLGDRIDASAPPGVGATCKDSALRQSDAV